MLSRLVSHYHTIFIEYRLLVQEDNIHYMYSIKIKCSSQHAYWANVDLPFSSSVCVKMTDFDEHHYKNRRKIFGQTRMIKIKEYG